MAGRENNKSVFVTANDIFRQYLAEKASSGVPEMDTEDAFYGCFADDSIETDVTGPEEDANEELAETDGSGDGEIGWIFEDYDIEDFFPDYQDELLTEDLPEDDLEEEPSGSGDRPDTENGFFPGSSLPEGTEESVAAIEDAESAGTDAEPEHTFDESEDLYEEDFDEEDIGEDPTPEEPYTETDPAVSEDGVTPESVENDVPASDEPQSGGAGARPATSRVVFKFPKVDDVEEYVDSEYDGSDEEQEIPLSEAGEPFDRIIRDEPAPPEKEEREEERACGKENREQPKVSSTRRDLSDCLENGDFPGVFGEKKMKRRDIVGMAEPAKPETDKRFIPGSKPGKEDLNVSGELAKALKQAGAEQKVLKVFSSPNFTAVIFEANESMKRIGAGQIPEEIKKRFGERVTVDNDSGDGITFLVEKEDKEPLYTYDVLNSESFLRNGLPVPVPFGADVRGRAAAAPVSFLDNILVSGNRGTGKTSLLRSVILGVICASTPDEAALMILDPDDQMPESFGKIPHMLMPVEKDSGRCIAALKWVANELDRRVSVFEKAGAKSYSDYIAKAGRSGRTSSKTMPELIVVCDEYGILMESGIADTEKILLSILTWGNVAGIHLILSTRKVSVDVLTGVLKANINTRIALKVDSQYQSKTIIDRGGAEKLLSSGDGLLYYNDWFKTVRLALAYTREEDIAAVTDRAVNIFGRPAYRKNLLEALEGPEET